MKKFIYTGSQAHNSTIQVKEGDKLVKKDLRLSPGDEAELPEDHEVVAALISQGHLVEPKPNSSKTIQK